MKLILIRHGDAGAYTHPDSERNLSEIGKAQAQKTAKWLQQNANPTLFISSPYNRAMQTCEIVKQAFADVEHQIFANITPDDDAQTAINGLADLLANMNDDDCVVIVCHMNIIAYMAGLLTGEQPESFGLAEARILETNVLSNGLATQIGKFVPN
ncbi:phosphohistidine phosphatase SixA [Faucicola boevrei]|uniref:phosphohistidine phosphatase SixA n=1 Tax=Faucicola boevrei TaxID=346665 RepID=UPI000379931D|nr:phosphohistidine phosphatase SixA [Moraxella boevrei]